MHQWFRDLADPRPEVRSKAAENLMGLSSDELPALRDLVRDSAPLQPAQKLALREIVNQVFLSGMKYEEQDPPAPFVGLQWSIQSDSTDSFGRVLVQRRLPGFSSYRMLHDGDAILSIRELPGIPIPNTAAFTAQIQAFKPGQTVHLDILRDGIPMVAAIELRAKPANTDDAMRTEAWINGRSEAADQYWQTNFAPIVGDDGLS